MVTDQSVRDRIATRCGLIPVAVRLLPEALPVRLFTPADSHVALADFTEGAADGDRTRALSVLLANAVDEIARGHHRHAVDYLGAAATVVQRIDAARRELVQL